MLGSQNSSLELGNDDGSRSSRITMTETKIKMVIVRVIVVMAKRAMAMMKTSNRHTKLLDSSKRTTN